MGKTQFYTSFVNSIVAILLQTLIIQGNSNVLQKQSWKVLSRLDSETITDSFTISFALEVYTGRMDQ